VKPIKLIIGASGSGKNFLVETFHCQAIPSYTTRPPRQGEIDGIEHSFSTMEEWEKFFKNQNNIVAWTEYHNNFYWSTVEQFEYEENDTYIIDPAGLFSMFDKYDQGLLDRPFSIVYLKVPLWKRIRNMRRRKDSWKNILKRVLNDWVIFTKFENDLKYFSENFPVKIVEF